MKPLRLATLGSFLSICLLSLTACQTFDGVMQDLESIKLPSLNGATAASSRELVYSGNCPQVDAVEELKTLADFSDLSDMSDYNLVSRINIAKIQNACSYDERSVTIDLRMDFNGKRGPKSAGASSFSYPFFVAVTSASGEILAKEIFAAGLTYSGNETDQIYTEKLRQIIPIENKDHGARYKILVGFQLTPGQLSYNRKMIQEEQRQKEEALRQDAEKAKETIFEEQTQQIPEQAQKEIYIGRPVDITQ